MQDKPWKTIHRDADKPPQALFDHLLARAVPKGFTAGVVASHHRSGAYYAALDVSNQHGAHQVIGTVVEYRITGYDPEKGVEIQYRLWDERDNPHLAKAPESILEKLSPTANPDAGKWRTRCREYAQRAREAGPLYQQYARGHLVHLPEPITFEDGRKRQAFVIVQPERVEGRGPFAQSLEDGEVVDLMPYRHHLRRVHPNPQLGSELRHVPMTMREVPMGDQAMYVAYTMEYRPGKGLETTIVDASMDRRSIENEVRAHNRALEPMARPPSPDEMFPVDEGPSP